MIIMMTIGTMMTMTMMMMTKMTMLMLMMMMMTMIKMMLELTRRRTQKELVLSSYTVPPGTCVIYWTFMAARSESQYGRPTEFLPERWLRGQTEYKRAHAFSHIPFGHGPRSCIGRRFAEMEVAILVIKILQRFRLEYEGPGLGLTMAITNKPDRQVNIKFRDRKKQL